LSRLTYSLLLYLIAPIIWCYFLFRAIKAPEYRNGFLQRLGILPQPILTNGIVIHCASVGETMAAIPLIKKILQTYPDSSITVTTTTPTGKSTLLNNFEGLVNHFYLPIDWPGSCRRFLTKLQPQLVILMETELWPNFLHQCGKNKIPVLLANARLSDKSFKKYSKQSKLSYELFSNVSKIAAQFVSDKQNFLDLGVSPEKIEVVGSIKFDLTIAESVLQQQQQLKLQWIKNRPTWIAASIHPGEFEAVLSAHKHLLKSLPDILLIAVPRHPEKFEALKLACSNAGLGYISRTDNIAPDQDINLVVGDTMGEMSLFCGIADIAFVGGSLIERGGHNPLEPIACGTPVIMGSHYFNFSDVCQILIDNKLLQVANSNDELATLLQHNLQDRKRLSELSVSAHLIIQKNSGCVDKMMKLIEAQIKH
jgi:3-deoxy-D-manno-octulosonic-acid transferase